MISAGTAPKTSLTIALVSFVEGLGNAARLKLTRDTINNSTADLMLFCGHTIGFVNDIEELKAEITNAHTEVILELQNINSGKMNNCLYRISEGKLTSMYSSQLFSTSGEIEGNYQLAEYLLNELKTRRSFKCQGFDIVVMQCGELNILKNLQAESNRVVFRIHDDKALKNGFQEFFSETKVFLNPIHTPMGNQGKMNKRRIFLSKSNRYYFSCSNAANKMKLNLKSLQYALYDGKPLAAIDEETSEQCLTKVYQLKL